MASAIEEIDGHDEGVNPFKAIVEGEEQRIVLSGTKLDNVETISALCSCLRECDMTRKTDFEFILCALEDSNLSLLLESIAFWNSHALKLSWNKITSSGVTSLSSFFHSSVTDVKILDLEGNYLNDEGCRELCVLMPEGLRVETLNLQGNNITSVGIYYMQQFLFRRQVKIKDLRLNNNELSSKGAHVLFDSLSLPGCAVTTLHLASVRLGETGAAYLSQFLATNSSVSFLDISNNDIGDTGLMRIAQALRQNESLFSIDISDNNIGPEGVAHLAAFLSSNTALTTIKLSRTNSRLKNIGELGAKHMGQLLAQNSSLTSIDLYGCLIGTAGAAEIAAGLRTNSTLRVINLAGNFIGPLGVKCIRMALEGPEYILTTNSSFVKLRSPTEPMKFYRKSQKQLNRVKKSPAVVEPAAHLAVPDVSTAVSIVSLL